MIVMTPRKRYCELCNADMGMGLRVRVLLQWERDRSSSGYDSSCCHVCTKCATKLSHLMGLEVPR